MSDGQRSLDTNVVIDLLRGIEPAIKHVESFLSAGGILIGSAVIRAEVLAGAREREMSSTTSLLDAIEWIPVGNSVADLAGELARKYRDSHKGIDIADYIIAATAIETGAELWTNNVKHFPMFKGLTAPY